MAIVDSEPAKAPQLQLYLQNGAKIALIEKDESIAQTTNYMVLSIPPSPIRFVNRFLKAKYYFLNYVNTCI